MSNFVKRSLNVLGNVISIRVIKWYSYKTTHFLKFGIRSSIQSSVKMMHDTDEKKRKMMDYGNQPIGGLSLGRMNNHLRSSEITLGI